MLNAPTNTHTDLEMEGIAAEEGVTPKSEEAVEESWEGCWPKTAVLAGVLKPPNEGCADPPGDAINAGGLANPPIPDGCWAPGGLPIGLGAGIPKRPVAGLPGLCFLTPPTPNISSLISEMTRLFHHMNSSFVHIRAAAPMIHTYSSFNIVFYRPSYITQPKGLSYLG